MRLSRGKKKKDVLWAAVLLRALPLVAEQRDQLTHGSKVGPVLQTHSTTSLVKRKQEIAFRHPT